MTTVEAPKGIEDIVEVERKLEPAVEASRANIQRAGVGIVRADDVELKQSGAGLVVVGGRAALDRAGARTILTAGPLEMQRSGAGSLTSLGDVQLRQSGSAALVARSATVGEGGFIGFAFTPRLEVGYGGRVLAGPREVALLSIVAGLAGAVTVVLIRLVGMRRARAIG